MEGLDVLSIIQIILSILLVTAILLQRSDTGAGGAFGGSDMGQSFHTKRGAERTLFKITIFIAILFALSAFAALIL